MVSVDGYQPPIPLRALTLDVAWERAYRRLRSTCVMLCDEGRVTDDTLAHQLAEISHQLTKDLIDAGVGGTLAYQLARPPEKG